MPDAKLLEEIYSPSYVAAHYSPELSNEVCSLDLEKEIERALGQARERRPGGRFLDVGCGSGHFMQVAARAGFATEGYEITAGAASVASERTHCVVHTGALGDLDERYDVVHLADVLEHAPQPAALLRDAIRLLSHDGLLLLRGPLENHRNLFHMITVAQRKLRRRLFGGRPVEMPPYHVQLFTLEGWRSLISGAGLRTVVEEVTEVHWPAPESFSLRAVWAVKALSLGLTRSPIGRHLTLGNRIMGLFRSDAAAQSVPFVA